MTTTTQAPPRRHPSPPAVKAAGELIRGAQRYRAPVWMPGLRVIVIGGIVAILAHGGMRIANTIASSASPSQAQTYAALLCKGGDYTPHRCSCAVAMTIGATEAGPGSAWWDAKAECRRVGAAEGWRVDDLPRLLGESE